ncbi:uncharacterized protein LY79DRAFT_673485 [Colletotrichum navitas]|uniref:Uncharacterized protein n=1 Tax=Colletotrichum navitas TaxID=681940 RepID=A0AAD8UZX5_9PEZI|nr:uncharacterized protein LY79DRAFT_673485 [Colletotrichum navitas]KAK1573673.1 hypothetical protein LY79DRAFT_673485 [Colletotrichum navitas]
MEYHVIPRDLILLLERQDDTIAMVTPVERDITVSLVFMKDSILKAFETKMAIPDHIASFVGSIVDDVMVQAHISSAMRLQHLAEERRRDRASAVARSSGPGSIQKTTRNRSRESNRVGVWMDKQTEDWHLIQNITQQTSTGVTYATLIRSGNRLLSKVLYFEIAFQPYNENGIGVTLSFVCSRFQSMMIHIYGSGY